MASGRTRSTPVSWTRPRRRRPRVRPRWSFGICPHWPVRDRARARPRWDDAHQHGVVHRDIKPENILISAGHAVVADFGIARAIQAAGAPTVTQTGILLGTPAYMSPGQAAGDSELDGRSDIYSLGCVLFEMWAGA